MPEIGDPEVRILSQLLQQLQSDYRNDSDEWAGSPFAWMRGRPSSRQKGTIGEKLVHKYLARKGFAITKSPDREADRIINQTARVEIKLSLLWEKQEYVFQQIRDQNYHFAICLGISPLNAHCWVLPKEIILEQWNSGEGIKPQHGGQEGSDTAWLHVDPNDVPSWLTQWGGRLSDALPIVVRLTGREPLR